MMRLSMCRAFLGLLVALSIASQGLAVPLAPGGNVAVSGTTVVARPELAGLIIYDVLLDFEIRDQFNALLYQGVLQNRVVREDVAGTLDFYYRIRDTQSGLNGILDLLETTGFAGWSTDVDYRTDSLGDVGPTRATRSADGDLVSFIFGGDPVFSGTESLFMFIQTEAMDFVVDATTALWLTTGESSAMLVTARPIPEPATVGLLALGALGLLRRRG